MFLTVVAIGQRGTTALNTIRRHRTTAIRNFRRRPVSRMLLAISLIWNRTTFATIAGLRHRPTLGDVNIICCRQTDSHRKHDKQKRDGLPHSPPPMPTEALAKAGPFLSTSRPTLFLFATTTPTIMIAPPQALITVGRSPRKSAAKPTPMIGSK